MWKQIKQRREELGLSTYDMAEYLGISQPLYYYHESGKAKKTPKNILNKVLDKLGMERDTEVSLLIKYPQKVIDWINSDKGMEIIMEAYNDQNKTLLPSRKYQREWRKKRINQGLCPVCGGERKNDLIHCESCLKKMREKNK